MSTPAQSTRHGAAVTGCADVLCDGTGRLGLLSYLVPTDLTVREGDAVRVPFGKREVHGIVVGRGNASRATRPILEVFGKRADPADIALARTLARYHFSEVSAVLPRLAPRSGRGAEAITDTTISLAADLPGPWAAPADRSGAPRRTIVRPPLVDPAALAAREAAHLASLRPAGQVLVLCPTTELVEAVVACFTSGAQRLDAKAPRGAWKGFCDGQVRIGVGTRAAALYAATELAGIVVVEEDHPGHLEAVQPHTHARDVAVARTRNLHLPLVLISAAPTPAALAGGNAVYTLSGKNTWPHMRLIDRGEIDPRQRHMPTQLSVALGAAARAGKTPRVLTGRRAAVRRCIRCKAPQQCTECTSSLCRHPQAGPCPRCGGTDGVRVSGWDAERLGELFGKQAQVVDLATLADVRDAGLVVIYDIDAYLSAAELIPDTVASHVIMTAARAAGAGGTVLAMTSEAHLPVLEDYFTRHDQLAPARRAVVAARDLGLPPYGRLITVRSGKKRAPNVDGWPGTVWGPRQLGESEWEVLVRVANEELELMRPHIDKLRRGGKVRVTIT